MISTYRATALTTLLAGILCAGNVTAEHVNPDQDKIDAAKDRTALNDAIAAEKKSQIALAQSNFPLFPDGFGKAGALTVEAADRDKFHVTARTADAFKQAAAKVAAALPAPDAKGKMSILLTDADRNAVAVYLRLNQRIVPVTTNMCALGDKIALATEESPAAALLGAGSLLTEIAQFTQLFRTDKSLSFTSTDLADDILFDLLAVTAHDRLLYPAAGVDALLDGSYQTEFAKAVRTMTRCRTAKLKVPATSEKDKAVLAAVDAIATEMAGTDAGTGLPVLLSALRGELVNNSFSMANAVLTVRVAAKGGASLKTSSIWRSDRLYAAGGAVVAYTLTDKQAPQPGHTAMPRVLMADVVTVETAFMQVPLQK